MLTMNVNISFLLLCCTRAIDGNGLDLESHQITNDRVTRFEAIIRHQQDQLDELYALLDGHNLSDLANRFKRQIPEAVAFSAYLDHDLGNIGPGYTIHMRGVELNDGNGYNPHTGVFTVPVSGVYLLTYTLNDFHDHRIWSKMVVDSALKLSVITSPIFNHYHNNDQATNTVILRLNKGQSVWVAVDERESAGASLQGDGDLRSTTFSGALLYPTA